MSSPEEKLRAVGATVERLKPAFKFRFEMADDIVITGSEEWLVEDLLPRRGLAAIYGPPSCGKSFLALDVAMHAAAGQKWFGKQVTQGAVVYIAAEAGAGFRKRIVACRKALGIHGRVPFALVTVAPNLGAAGDSGEAARLIDEIRKQAAMLGQPISLVVVDTLARTMFGADENNTGMAAFIGNCGLVADAFGCLVIAVHHSGKDAERGMRGASSLHGACDAEWEIKALPGTPSKTVTLVKNKDGEDGLTWSFSLGIETVFDPAKQGGETSANVSLLGKPVTSCYVKAETLPKQADAVRSRKVPTGDKKLVLDAVRDALIEHGRDMPSHADLPSGQGVERSFIRENAYSRGLGDPEKPDARRSQFSRAMSGLIGDGWVAQWDEWVWLCP